VIGFDTAAKEREVVVQTMPPAKRNASASEIAFVERGFLLSHRIVFSLADMSHEQRVEHIGWATLAVLLLFTALAYA